MNIHSNNVVLDIEKSYSIPTIIKVFTRIITYLLNRINNKSHPNFVEPHLRIQRQNSLYHKVEGDKTNNITHLTKNYLIENRLDAHT